LICQDFSNILSARSLLELWDDLASNREDIPITPAQIAEIERRLEEYRKNPDLGSTWEEVKARILGQNR
jgi:putative addiction module component (TIGR02574 family)